MVSLVSSPTEEEKKGEWNDALKVSRPVVER
jgi:hypothetical protein